MTEDAELLRRYADEKSEAAFAALVERHLALVYHAALRQCSDSRRAEEVAQTVFTDLARKAAALGGRKDLTGWLHQSTRYAVLRAARAERRRVAREQKAYAMNQNTNDSPGDEAWARVRPFIDEALHSLGQRDRLAVLWRFFEGRTLAEVAEKLAVSEDAARMRVDRALNKLQGRLSRQGVTSTSAALALALGSQAMGAAPAGLGASIAGGKKSIDR